MIRLVTLSTGADGESHVDEQHIDLAAYGRDLASSWLTAGRIRFQESPPGSTLDWHPAPRRQLVVILRGTIAFETRGAGCQSSVDPGGLSWKRIRPAVNQLDARSRP